MREQAMRTTKGLRIGRVALIACALAGAWLQVPAAQVAQGRWNTVLTSGGLPALVTINPVHMALMHNGKVLIAGGGTNTAELYDPATNTAALTGSMSTSRQNHTATLLSDGTVLE